MSTDSHHSEQLELQALQRRQQITELSALILDYDLDTSIDFLTPVKIDDWGTVTVGTWGGYHIQIAPMLVNDRLVMTPAHTLGIYDHGWCFPKGPAVLLAALVWDPQTQAEPVGFSKRIGPQRQPGTKASPGVDPALRAAYSSIAERYGRRP